MRMPRKLKKAIKKWNNFSKDLYYCGADSYEVVPPRTDKEQDAIDRSNNIYTKRMSLDEFIEIYPMTTEQIKQLKNNFNK